MFKKYLLEKSEGTRVQFIRYGFVAAIAFFIDFGLLYLFTNTFHIFYLVSATLSFLISLVVNFLLSFTWAFPKSAKSLKFQIVVFFIIGITGLLLNLGIIWVLTSLLGVYYLISKLVAILIVFFWSFIARRKLFNS